MRGKDGRVIVPSLRGESSLNIYEKIRRISLVNYIFMIHLLPVQLFALAEQVSDVSNTPFTWTGIIEGTNRKSNGDIAVRDSVQVFGRGNRTIAGSQRYKIGL